MNPGCDGCETVDLLADLEQALVVARERDLVELLDAVIERIREERRRHDG